MGKIKYLNKIRELFNKKPVVSLDEIRVILNFLKKKFKLQEDYSYLLVHNLVKKGEIKRITKSYYSKYDDPVFSVLCFQPAYLALEEALSFHNLWEQETNVVIISSKKIRTGPRNILDSKVILHRIKKEYFFGYEFLKYGNFYLPISDIEKTFIDLVYFKRRLDKETMKDLRKKIDKKKLKKYLERYPLKIRKKVLNMLHLK